jgi:hypothetical protein
LITNMIATIRRLRESFSQVPWALLHLSENAYRLLISTPRVTLYQLPLSVNDRMRNYTLFIASIGPRERSAFLSHTWSRHAPLKLRIRRT